MLGGRASRRAEGGPRIHQDSGKGILWEGESRQSTFFITFLFFQIPYTGRASLTMGGKIVGTKTGVRLARAWPTMITRLVGTKWGKYEPPTCLSAELAQTQ